MDIRPVGDRAVLVEFADRGQRRDLADQLRSAGHDLVTEVVEGAVTVLARVARSDELPMLVALLQSITPRPDAPADPEPAEPVLIPTHYDGPDLADVCRHTGLTRLELVTLHTGINWVVDFAGFLPGFAYLVPIDSDAPWLQVPRRATPRTHVPPGSLALAGRWSGVYPSASPGGWQLIGRTDLQLWDPEREQPALLTPGRRIRFEEIR